MAEAYSNIGLIIVITSCLNNAWTILDIMLKKPFNFISFTNNSLYMIIPCEMLINCYT